MTYNGNQLINIVDYAESQNSNSIKEYQDYSDSDKTEMLYDDNGAIVRDLDRNILSIQNNLLSLPSEITFDNGNKIFHYYDATGQRYRTESVTYQWTGVTRPAGTGNSGTSQSTLTTINNITHINDNVVYKQQNSGPITLSRANNPEGYVAPTIRERGDGIDASLRHGMSFCYYIKDHLGNIREVYSSCKVTHVDFATLDDDGNPMVINQYNTPLTCTQRTQYYPSGLPWRDCYHADVQPIKYNSKEFVEMHGLDEYDSKARWYYPAIMRTTTMDPLCEKYYDISPYAWCGNNPVNYIDPDGREIKVGTWYGRLLASFGIRNFEYKVQKDINKLTLLSPKLASTINNLERSSATYNIKPTIERPDYDSKYNKKNWNGYLSDNKTVYYDPDNVQGACGIRPPEAGLMHELGHAENDEQGKRISYNAKAARSGDETEKARWNQNEKHSIELENEVYRAEQINIKRNETYIE